MIAALKEFFAWLKKQPVIGPLLGILNSRKGMIAVALTGAILKALPELEKVHSELNVVVAALVTLVVIWLFTSFGYAYEDAAAKSAPPAVVPTVVPGMVSVGGAGTVVSNTTTSTTTTASSTQPESSGTEPVG